MTLLGVISLSLTLSYTIATTCPLVAQIPLNDICHGPASVYSIEPSPGKGLGVFATHKLELGDTIMRESPIIKITPPKISPGDAYPMSRVSDSVREKFQLLSLEEQKEVLSLTFTGTSTGNKSADTLGLIFRTNAYNTGSQIGLFPKIARINHSCRPNLSYYWSAKLNKRVVYATRRIEVGEELSVSYISLLLTRNERRRRLHRYGFSCQCEVCAQNIAEVRLSNDRRISIKNAFADFETQMSLTPLETKTARSQGRKNAKASLQLTELVHQEGLADYYAKVYKVVAVSHARIEDWESAAIWANKGYELRFIEDPQSQATLEMHYLTTNFIKNWEQHLLDASHG